MKIVQSKFKDIDGNLLAMKRDTVNGWFYLEVGLPKSWVYDGNDDIECETINKTDIGEIIKIAPKNPEIEIDDLISFVKIIINTNEKIVRKEEEFKKRMEELKQHLEDEAKKFYGELDDLKDSSFKNISHEYNNKVKEQKDDDAVETNDDKSIKEGHQPTDKLDTSNPPTDKGKDKPKRKYTKKSTTAKTD